MTLRDLINALAAADHLSRQASESDKIGRRLGTAEAGTLAAAHIMAACRQYDQAARSRLTAKTCPGADRIETACVALTGEYTADTLRKLAAMRAIETGRTLDELLKLDTTAAAAVLIGKPEGDGLEWSKPVAYADLRKALTLSQNTLKSRLVEGRDPVEGKIRYIAPTDTARKIQVVVSDLPADLQARFRRSNK